MTLPDTAPPTGRAAPGVPDRPAAAGPGRPDPAVSAAAIAAGRAEIDGIDAEILRLLDRRRSASQQVQHARRAAGGPRLEHSRETEVVRRYADRLGRPGPALALAVLEHCRGPVTAVPRPGRSG